MKKYILIKENTCSVSPQSFSFLLSVCEQKEDKKVTYPSFCFNISIFFLEKCDLIIDFRAIKLSIKQHCFYGSVRQVVEWHVRELHSYSLDRIVPVDSSFVRRVVPSLFPVLQLHHRLAVHLWNLLAQRCSLDCSSKELVLVQNRSNYRVEKILHQTNFTIVEF